MASLKPLDKGLGCCEGNQRIWLESFTRTLARWSFLDVPRGGSVYTENGNGGLPQRFDDSREWLADATREGES